MLPSGIHLVDQIYFIQQNHITSQSFKRGIEIENNRQSPIVYSVHLSYHYILNVLI